MRSRMSISVLLLIGALGFARPMQGQQVVDRIVARVEGDIITLSEVRELGSFQRLVEGRSASDEDLLRQLIEQWIVAAEADAAKFPRPTTAEVDGEMKRLVGQFPSPQAFLGQRKEVGLSESAIRRLLARQLWLARYLDYKFRPAAQVDDAQIERYYREELAPQLTKRGQPVPPIDEVRERIREVLIQHEISQRATRWLEETRPRLHIEVEPGGPKP